MIQYGVKMKNSPFYIALSSLFLFSCGGGGSGSDPTGGAGSDPTGGSTPETSKEELIANLSYTSWKKDCFLYNQPSSDDSTVSWYAIIKLRIDSSMNATYTTEFFHPTDTVCRSMEFNTTDIAKFEFINKIVTEESIPAFGLNETFVFNSCLLYTSPSPRD